MDTAPQATLKIRWKRLVVGARKQTAPRHVATEKALDTAFARLQKSLAPLGIQVTLQKAALSDKKFQSNPLLSNRIWINGAALEMHLPQAKAGQVKEKETGIPLRTVDFAGRSFSDVPPGFIVQAGLIAAAESVKQALAETHVLATKGNGCDVGGQAAASKAPVSAPATAPAKSDCCEKPTAAKKSDCCEKPTAAKKGDCCEKPTAAKKGDCCEKPTGATKSDCCEKPTGAKKSDCCEKPTGAKKGDCCEKPTGAKKGDCCEKPSATKGDCFEKPDPVGKTQTGKSKTPKK